MNNTIKITLGMLGVSFVVLKLCNVISWHWAIVTFPFWIIPAIAALLLAIAVQMFGIAGLIDHYQKKNLERKLKELARRI